MMEIITHEKREDIEGLMAENLIGSDQINKIRRNMAILASVMFITGIFVLVFFISQEFDFFTNPFLLAITAVMLVFPIYLILKYFVFFDNFRRKVSSNTMKGKNVESYLGKNRIMIDEVGVHRSNKFRDEHFFWNGIIKVTDAKEHIFIFDTDISALIVPKRDFKSKDHIRDFLDRIEKYRSL